MKSLIEKVWEISQQNPKGFTITIPNCEPVTKGWAIGMMRTQHSFGKLGLIKVIEVSLETTKVVGGWQGYDGRYYFDAVLLAYTRGAAARLVVENGQMTAYNLETGEFI